MVFSFISVKIPSSNQPNTSLSSSSTIPCSETAKHRYLKLESIQVFLTNPIQPSDLLDNAFKCFVQYAARFFIQEEKLWKKDPRMKHKLFILENQCFKLIQQAHDDMGHKSVFTVCMCLLERFWWP
jgi:hypothetical protein